MIAQVIGQRLHHLGIGELQQPRPLFHQDHAHAQGREHARVFDADDAAAHHDHRFRNLRHIQHLVAIDDVAAVDRHFRRRGRLGAGRDDNVFGAESLLLTRVGYPHRVRIDKTRDAGDQLDIVARQLGLDHIHFGLDHMLDAKRQVRHGDLVLDAIVHAIDVLVVIAGEMKYGLAEGFAGDCACVDTHPAHHFTTLHQSHLLAHLGALNGRALPRWSGADNNKIVGLHRETNLTHETAQDRTKTASRSDVNRVKTG